MPRIAPAVHAPGRFPAEKPGLEPLAGRSGFLAEPAPGDRRGYIASARGGKGPEPRFPARQFLPF